MNRLKTVSKQPAALCVIQMSAESTFIVFLKGKNFFLLKRQKSLFPLIIVGNELLKERLVLKLQLEAWCHFGHEMGYRRPFNSIWSGEESRVRILYHSKCSNRYQYNILLICKWAVENQKQSCFKKWQHVWLIFQRPKQPSLLYLVYITNILPEHFQHI